MPLFGERGRWAVSPTGGLDLGGAAVAGGLSKRYGKRRGVDDVSFAVRSGQICALLGPNGAGNPVTEL